jgi:lysozyme
VELRPTWFSRMKVASGGFTPSAAFLADLMRHEGFRPLPYLDSRGVLTVGIGFNLERSAAPGLLAAAGLDPEAVKSGARPLTEEEAWVLARRDLQTAVSDAHQIFPNFASLPPGVQEVLVNMAYNLGGPKLAGFVNMRAAVAAGDFASAAHHMLDSRWAGQVGGRATELAEKMRRGGATSGQSQPPPSAGGRASHPSPSPAPAEGDTVVVAAGDTLSGIAARHLGNPNLWGEVARLNGITDPRQIRPGQKLRIR